MVDRQYEDDSVGNVASDARARLGLQDLLFPPLERGSALRRPVAVADPLVDLNCYPAHKVQQVLDQVDPRTAQAIRELRPRTLAQCRSQSAPLCERIADAQAGMADGMYGMEVLAEAELRDAQAEAPLIQAAQDRIIAAAVCRAVLRARIIRRASDAATATLSRHHATVALVIIAIAAGRAFAFAGRRSCARGDDPDGASATIGRCSGHFVMEKPSTLRGVGGFLCDRQEKVYGITESAISPDVRRSGRPPAGWAPGVPRRLADPPSLWRADHPRR